MWFDFQRATPEDVKVAETTTRVTGAEVQSLHAFIRHHFGAGDRLYAVVDAARDRALASAARTRFGLELQWLFRGPTPVLDDDAEKAPRNRLQTLQEAFESGARSRMAAVAPYAVEIPFAGRTAHGKASFLDLWAERLGTSAGILLLTPADPASLVVHLRSIFHATGEDLHKYYFRFYDPRVLRAYLPTCTPADAKEFFGPVAQVLCEDDKPGALLQCRADRNGVRIDRHRLSGPEPAEPPRGGGRR